VSAPQLAAEQGMDAATYAADMRIVGIIDGLIAVANASGRPWSANDIRDQFPTCEPGLIGSRINAAFMRRPVEMEKVGEVKSSLVGTHNKKIARWCGVTV
jgi:hypothetical protein